MSIGERIREVRKENRLTQTDFAKRLRIAPSSLSRLESGENNPADRTVALICSEFGVREEWLRDGNGPMREEKEREAEITDAVNRILSGRNPDFKRRLFLALSTLDEDQWDVLLEKLMEIAGIRLPQQETKNPHDFTEEEIVEAAKRDLALSREEGGALSGSGPGSESTATG